MPRWVSWFHLSWSGSLINGDVAAAGGKVNGRRSQSA